MFRFRDTLPITIGFSLIVAIASLIFANKDRLATADDESVQLAGRRRKMAMKVDSTWTSWQIPVTATAMRILTNAAIDEDYDVETNKPSMREPREGFRYSVEYQLLDAGLSVIRQGHYHFRGKLTEQADDESGDAKTSIQMSDKAIPVTSTRIMQVQLGGDLDDVRIVRLRSHRKDQRLDSILARIVAKSQRNGFDRIGAWHKITDSRKESVSRHCVYDHQLLGETERMNLLKWKWSRATPMGNFAREILYFVGENRAPAVQRELPPPGQIVKPGWRTTVEVPETPGRLEIIGTPLNTDTDRIGHLAVHRDGASGREQIQLTFPDLEDSSDQPQHKETSVYLETFGGLLEIESDSPVALRYLFHDQKLEAGPTELFSANSLLPFYLADEQPVVYSITHIDDQPTPLKIGFRIADESLFSGRSTESELKATMEVLWRFVDKEGKEISSGLISETSAKSNYERVTRSGTGFSVSEPVRKWFSVPVGVAKVEFYGLDSSVLVSAFVRPDMLAAKTRVPEDYRDSGRAHSPHRRWFVIRPDNMSQYVAQNRRVNLAIQPRLGPIDQEETDRRAWTVFRPNGDWLGVQMMVPSMDPLELIDAMPADSTTQWRELESGADTAYTLAPQTHADGMLKLVFVSDQPAGKLSLSCDGELVQSQDFASTRGELSVRMPQASGVLRAEFQPGVRLFVRGVQTENPNTWLRRRAIRIANKPIRFDYQKQTRDEEFLTLTVYREHDESARADVSVEIIPEQGLDLSGENPRESWTILKREYDLQELQVAPSVLIDRPGRLDSGSRCFVKLGSDLPPGRYSIVVNRKNSSRGFFRLHQATVDSGQVRRIGVFDHYE